MSLKGRLRRLEERARGRRCQECGLPPDGPGYIVCSDEGLPENPDERCPKCGRRLWFVIEVVEPVEGEGVAVGWPM